jgi:hypothetical protein
MGFLSEWLYGKPDECPPHIWGKWWNVHHIQRRYCKRCGLDEWHGSNLSDHPLTESDIRRAEAEHDCPGKE